ncbi:MAG TPA: sigma-70 family RNA polymerase sigma factor, partial [Planctomycetota bacterium]|nr:sigma-70 family RNA polymerase sigma factor [Planctomycetota bacterium]
MTILAQGKLETTSWPARTARSRRRLERPRWSQEGGGPGRAAIEASPGGQAPSNHPGPKSRTRPLRDPSDSEDLSHVEAFLAGDENAFRALFDKYREKVYRIAFRFVRNKDDALEVTQEVFLRVYLSLKSFQTNSKFFTWLYRIAVNRSIDFSRSRRHDPTTSLDAV